MNTTARFQGAPPKVLPTRRGYRVNRIELRSGRDATHDRGRTARPRPIERRVRVEAERAAIEYESKPATAPDDDDLEQLQAALDLLSKALGILQGEPSEPRS